MNIDMSIKLNTDIKIDQETAELCLKVAEVYANQNCLMINSEDKKDEIGDDEFYGSFTKQKYMFV